MFIKAMLPNGFFQIYADVSEITMSPPDRDYGFLTVLLPTQHEGKPDLEGKVYLSEENVMQMIDDVYSSVRTDHEDTKYGRDAEYQEDFTEADRILIKDPEKFKTGARAVMFKMKVGEYSIPKIIISQCRLFVCNDSGETMAKW